MRVKGDRIIYLKKLNEDSVVPILGTKQAIGRDICSTVDCEIGSNETVMIPTGFALSMPEDIGAFIIPRSGLGTKNGIVLANGVGLIDPDYRGEVKVGLFNRSKKSFSIKKGDRIAQMYFVEIPYIQIMEVENLDNTDRNEGGFGSTGK